MKHIKFADAWGEILGVVAAVIGGFVGMTTKSAGTAYAVVFIAGLAFGRQWHRARRGQPLYWYTITLGFLIGFSLGSIVHSSLSILVVLFALGMLVGYIIRKKFLHTVRY